MGKRYLMSEGTEAAEDPPPSTLPARAIYGRNADISGMSFPERRTALLIHLALLKSDCDVATIRLVYQYLGDANVVPLLTELRRDRAFTFSHSLRTMRFALLIAMRMGIDLRECATLCVGALLHDVGKLAVAAHILRLPRQLRPVEIDKIRTHPEAGYESICDKRIFGWNVILDIVRHHHEYLDGTGYPLGLTGQQISLRTRCVTVSDIYSALTENRPYRAAMSQEAAFHILDEMVTLGKLDGDVVEALRKGLLVEAIP